jgi:hypothetical protein
VVIARDPPGVLLVRQQSSSRYLDYLNKMAAETPLLKTEDFPDQKRAP